MVSFLSRSPSPRSALISGSSDLPLDSPALVDGTLGIKKMELLMGIEPMTSSLPRKCSTD
jgi:hypothetical protein